MQEAAEETTGPAWFKFSGEAFTRLARGFLAEGHPERAWRMATALIGEGSLDAAMKILAGTHRLVGDERDASLELEWHPPLVPTEYMASVFWTYAGLRQTPDGRWWRPIARVTSWGPDDMGQKQKPGIRFGERSEFYCAETERLMERESDVIYGATHARPAWWAPCLDERTALAELAEAGRRLEERGWALDMAPSASTSAPLKPLVLSAVERRAAQEKEDAEELTRTQAETKTYDACKSPSLHFSSMRLALEAAGIPVTPEAGK